MKRLFITYCFISVFAFSTVNQIQFANIALVDTQSQLSVSIVEEYSIQATKYFTDSPIDLLGPQYFIYTKKNSTNGFYEEFKTLNENYRRAQSLLISILKI